MNLFIEDEKLLKTYKEVWDKVSNIKEKGLDSAPVYNAKYLKTKVKKLRIFVIKVFLKMVLISLVYQ